MLFRLKSDFNSTCYTHPGLCSCDFDVPLQGHPPPHPVVSHPSSTVSFSPLPVGRMAGKKKHVTTQGRAIQSR